jgi:hypothetical protein
VSTAGQEAPNPHRSTAAAHYGLAVLGCKLVQVHHLATRGGSNGIDINARLAAFWHERALAILQPGHVMGPDGEGIRGNGPADEVMAGSLDDEAHIVGLGCRVPVNSRSAS